MNAEKQSKTMLQAISEMPSDAEMIERGSLPSGCLLHLETALTYARKAVNTEDPVEAGDAMKVVLEQLEEIQKKVRKAGK